MAKKRVIQPVQDVTLSEATVSRLLLLRRAKPYRDTFDSIIARLLDEHDAHHPLSSDQDEAAKPDIQLDRRCVLSVMNNTTIASVVLHDGALATKLFSGCDDLTPEGAKPTWNGLVVAMLLKLKVDATRLQYNIPGLGRNQSDPVALCKWLGDQSLGGNISPIPAHHDKSDTRLWYPVSDLGIRFRGMSSPQAWRTVRGLVRIMQHLAGSTRENRVGRRHGGIGLDLRVKWADTGRYPGRHGIVSMQQFPDSAS